MTDKPDLDFLSNLLESGSQYKDKTDAPKWAAHKSSQRGPLRYYDNGNTRCVSRGCGSPTHYRFRGNPLCTVHCLQRMNEELTDENDEATC